jgi:anti-sigma regulatory factor (Ser/Thr protein kinase)
MVLTSLYMVRSCFLSGKSMEGVFEIKALSDPQLLSVIRATTGQIASIAGFKSRQIEQIKLAVDEVCTNIIRHTYKGDPNQEIILVFTLSKTGLEIRIQDFGEKVDPQTWQSPKTRRRRPGGLGLSLIRSAMDEIEFGLPTTTGNTCRLAKHKQNEEA